MTTPFGREHHKGTEVHGTFDAGPSDALRPSQPQAVAAERRAKMLDGNSVLQSDVEALRTEGYLVLRGLFPDKTKLAELREVSQKLLDAVPYGRNQFEGRKTRRVHNLASHTRSFDELVLNKRCLDILDYFLHPNHLLSILQLIEIWPGSAPQPLHYDSQSLYDIPRPRVDNPMQLAFFWALDDNYTPENGATVIYPRSHLWEKSRFPSPADEKVSFRLEPGDAICILGTLWHGGGHIPASGTKRLILTSQHVQPYIRQIENLLLATPFDVVDQMPERLQAMIGYSCHFPFYGSVDGVHPKKAIKPLLERYAKLKPRL